MRLRRAGAKRWAQEEDLEEVRGGAAKRPPTEAWIAGALAWAVPGAGHVWQGRVWRGLLLCGAVWAMFATGFLLGGHLFDITSLSNGPLSPVFGFCNLGVGLLYIVCWMANAGFAEYAERATFEYGNTFLIVAGLLNYLVLLDAFDIGAKRKQ